MSATKILIADDEPNILSLLEVMLKDLGTEIITAENGEIAYQKATEHRPHLIITDVVMPKKNGFELCRDIRNSPELMHTPIIILSALGDEYNKITGFEEGADDYVTKPFNVDELKARSKALLLRRGHKAAEAAPAQNKKEAPIYDANITALPTEIEALNQNLYGGLPKGSNILLLGPLGTGKSSFVRNFISQGLSTKEKCLYITIDDNPDHVRSVLTTKLGSNVEELEDADLIRFIDAYSWSSFAAAGKERFAIDGVLELTQLSGIIADASQELGQTVQDKMGGRRVIDSISSLLVSFDLPSMQRFVNQIARTAVSFGDVTTLFTLEEGTVPDQTVNNMKYIMDGVLEFNKIDGRRAVRAASMKWAKYNSDWIFLDS
ncbi:MAG: CheY-like chemotaxis protein [Candidatus Marinamargulisbacteria bacterium]|jgi:CheY-like chemotaxis protein